MPITHTMKQRASGESFVHTRQTGQVTGEDAKHLMPLRALPAPAVLESGSNDFTRSFAKA